MSGEMSEGMSGYRDTVPEWHMGNLVTLGEFKLHYNVQPV